MVTEVIACVQSPSCVRDVICDFPVPYMIPLFNDIESPFQTLTKASIHYFVLPFLEKERVGE